MRTLRTIGILVVCALGLAACTPTQIEWFKSQSPEVQAEVIRGLQGGPPPNDCYAAMRHYWPAHMHGWATKIINRESTGIPTAYNRQVVWVNGQANNAAGCMQLLLPLHGWRYTAIGCSPSDWSNAWCNVRAALHLYQQVGTGPWNL